MNLYRIMTEVCAGSHQRSVKAGEVGIVTLWVRANSEAVAVARAKLILANRRYASIGKLSAYVETLADDPLVSGTEAEHAAERRADSVATGYDAIKARALTQADGLHEVWLGAAARQDSSQPKVA
jgi:hypothetical protein